MILKNSFFLYSLYILIPIFAYLLGSLSSSIIICRLMGLPDPRTEGSKNPGATNVLRIGGSFPAALTLLGDILKGFIPVFLAQLVNPEAYFVGPVMILAFLGHLYPVFFKFHGGKGVATFLGTLFGAYWILGVQFLVIWLIIFILSHLSSLSSLLASIFATILASIFLGWEFALAVGVMTIFIVIRHQDNILRLLRGEEPKMDLFSKKSEK